jgi:hypothetical protein
MAVVGWWNEELLYSIITKKDYERRAAWICLLTAACAAVGKSEVVGDYTGGRFWLPPIDLWASWARETLESNKAMLRR